MSLQHNIRFLILLFLLLSGLQVRAGGPSGFIQNKGQWPDRFYFRAQSGSHRIWLERQQIHYQLRRADLHPMAQLHAKRFGEKIDTSGALGHDFRVFFSGSNAAVVPKASSDASSAHYNFFKGKASEWKSNVPAFSEVSYENLYPGIDLKVRNGDNFLKYDFELEPGRSGESICMEFQGTSGLELVGGRLRIKTALGTLEEHIPKAYQLANGVAKEISCSYILNGNRVGFRFAEKPDPRYRTVIDPLLVFFTYSGALDDNWANTAVSDQRGNSYTAGTIYGSSIPTTTGAIDRSYNGSDGEESYLSYDIALLKFDSTGSQLLYCTFLGGSGADTPHSLAIDKNNNLLILGSTSSPNFPVSANAFQSGFNGGPVEYPFGFENGYILPTYVLGADLFITKINENGSQILASTYLGGSGTDGIMTVYENLVTNYGDQFRSDLVCGPDGSVYIASHSHSPDFPTVSAFRGFRSGPMDGVVAKLNPALSELQWATYFGGSGEDAFYSLKLLPQNRIALCGGSNSPNIPVGLNAWQAGNNGGIDAMIAVFQASTGVFSGASYSGTSSYDQAYLVEGDAAGQIYILGQTMGIMPRTTAFGDNEGGNFIQKFNPDLSALSWSCTFGNTKRQPNIVPTGLMVDSCERIFIAGWGGTVNYSGNGFTGGYTVGLPVSTDALQANSADGSDFYFLVLGKNAGSMVYGTYLGADTRRGEHVDGGTSRFDKHGIITQAICGCRDRQGDYLRGTINAYQRDIRSDNCNNGVLKLNLFDLQASMDWAGTLACPATLTLTNNSQNGTTYIWDFGNGDTLASNNRIVEYTYRNPGKYWLSLRAINPKTCKYESVDGDSITIPDPFPFSPFSANDSFCVGDTLRPQFPQLAGYPLWWVPQNFVSDPTSASPTIIPLGSTLYKIQARNSNGCIREIPYDVKNRFLRLGIGMEKDFKPCEGKTTVRFFNTRDSSDFYLWNFGNGETYSGPEVTKTFPGSGNFPVMLSGGSGSCLENAFDTLRLFNQKVSILPAFDSELRYNGCNTPDLLLRNRTINATGYEWDFGDGNLSTESDPLHTFTEPGTYRVTLRAFKDGCIESASREIELKAISIPNLITANKDQKNETLQIEGLQPGWGLDVFNRWGKKVFSSDAYDNNWAPDDLEAGTYFYTLRFPEGGQCRAWFQVAGN